MPWKKEGTVFKLRKEFVHLASQSSTNISRLCKRFDISRKTGYKWLARWKAEGDPGLKDRSRRPKTHPNQTPPHIEQMVLDVHKRYSEWESRKLRACMLRLIEQNRLEMNADQVPVDH